MKILFVIIAVILLSFSCGKKDRPEYKSQVKYNKNII
jgi:hypothetical protein